MLQKANKTAITELLTTPVVLAAAEVLGDDKVRLVGGAVRDLVYGLKPADLDMATPIPPIEVMAKLQAKGHKVIPTGLEHGTVTLVLEGVPLEITTLRQDVSTDGRRATVAFTADWLEDAKRRDFTFNALSLTMSGEVIDYFGGVDDLLAGKVNFVGDARQRIQEDYLRILRYFRFFARFGKTPPTPKLEKILGQEAHKLKHLSGERIQKEVLNLLLLNQAHKSLTLMSKLGIDLHLFGCKFDQPAFAKLTGFEVEQGNPSALRRLAVLLGKNPKILSKLASRIKLSNLDSRNLKAMGTTNTLPLHEALYRFGPEYTVDQLMLASNPDVEKLEIANAWEKPTFPITGQDLMDLGYTTGVDLGEAKRKLETLWVTSNFTLSKAQLLEVLGKRKSQF